MITPEGVKRLNQAMERRRLDLDMSWRDVATAAQLSYEGLRGIRRGDRNPSALAARRLEDALRWQHGSIDAVLDGGEPTPADRPQTGQEPPDYSEWEPWAQEMWDAAKRHDFTDEAAWRGHRVHPYPTRAGTPTLSGVTETPHNPNRPSRPANLSGTSNDS